MKGTQIAHQLGGAVLRTLLRSILISDALEGDSFTGDELWQERSVQGDWFEKPGCVRIVRSHLWWRISSTSIAVVAL